MRPPVLPSGNPVKTEKKQPSWSRFNEAAGFTQRKPDRRACSCRSEPRASMRPPVLPSGNSAQYSSIVQPAPRFNEAAGFTQRKHFVHVLDSRYVLGFNEAAGFTQRKPTSAAGLPVEVNDCFNEAAGFTQRKPRLPAIGSWWRTCFNEAAGFTQRKRPAHAPCACVAGASMRPPVLPSGNPCMA